MITWTPLFSRITDSSLWREPLEVRVVFLTMLAKKDRDHVVRTDSYGLAGWAQMPEKDVIKALKILESPDTKREDPGENEGRRIQKVPGGWAILKGEYYRDMMKQGYQAAYMRQARIEKPEIYSKKRLRRKVPKRGKALAGEHQFLAMERAGQDVSCEPGQSIPLPVVEHPED